MSVGGIGTNRKQFGAMLPYVDHLPHTLDLARNAFSQGLPAHGAERADALEALVALHGAETIAAVMVEPVAGSTGVLPPPEGYLRRLRDICTKHGILLIFDEVITGFGRMGANFGAERLGVVPDIMTMAKGLTNAAVPMGAVAVPDGIYDAIVHGAPEGIELFHGYTYSGHPLAAAAAIASMDLQRAEDLPGRARAIEPYWQRAMHSLRGLPNVIDIRNAGLIAGIELQPREASRPSARTGVRPLLRRGAADPHDRRHHRPVAAADHRGGACRPHRRDADGRDPGGGSLAGPEPGIPAGLPTLIPRRAPAPAPAPAGRRAEAPRRSPCQ